MSILIAIAHIAGSLVSILLLSVFVLSTASREAERHKARALQQVAAKLGVAVSDLNDDRFVDRFLQLLVERSSNELLRNRLSDLCGTVRTLWGWLGFILQLISFGAAIWATFTANVSNAVFVWIALGIGLFFWVVNWLFSLLCYFLTGRYPGEAKLTRIGIEKFLNERRATFNEG